MSNNIITRRRFFGAKEKEDVSLTVDPAQIAAVSKGGTYNFIVSAIGGSNDFYIEEGYDSSFVQLTKKGTTGITAVVSENVNETPRNMTFRVYHADDRRTFVDVTISQSENIVVPIPEFDFITIRYYWTSQGGRDLDTVTVVKNSGVSSLDGNEVGYGHSYAVSPYLYHSGDNTGNGYESVYLDLTKVLANQPDSAPDKFTMDIYFDWYGSRGNGDTNLEVVAYKGGSMIKDGYNYINQGGKEVYRQSSTINTTSSCTGCSGRYETAYTKVAFITYDRKTKETTLTLVSTN